MFIPFDMVLANTGSFLSPFKQEYIYTYYNLFILGNDHVLQELANIKFTEATSIGNYYGG